MTALSPAVAGRVRGWFRSQSTLLRAAEASHPIILTPYRNTTRPPVASVAAQPSRSQEDGTVLVVRAMARLLCTLRRCGWMVISRTEEDATQEDYTHDTELSKRPLTRPTAAGENAGAGHPLPLGEGKYAPLPFSSKIGSRIQKLRSYGLHLAT